MKKGFDCSTPLNATTAAAFKKDGFEFVCRYAVPTGTKRLTKDEAKIISDAGLNIISVFETTANRPAGGAKAGLVDGMIALQVAINIGQPAGSAIYFCVDYDASSSDFNNIEAYFRAADKQIADYNIGIYGEEEVINEMKKRGVCAHYWQTYAWSRGKKSPAANIYQFKNGERLNGIEIDLDEAFGNEGGWNLKRGDVTMAKFKPVIIKERITQNGQDIKYISLKQQDKPYSKTGSDIRFIKFPYGSISFQFVAQKGAKASQLLKAYGADIAFNGPFFYNGVPLGNVEDHGLTPPGTGAYGKMLKWHEFGVLNGFPMIGQLDKNAAQWDVLVQSTPMLIENGKACWDWYAGIEETAPDIATGRKQRTAIGVTAAGDFMVAVSDGRTGSDQGCTIDEMGYYMLSKGAYNAINLDGGSSSILVSKTAGTYSPNGIMYPTYNAGGINQSLNTGINEAVINHAILIFCK